MLIRGLLLRTTILTCVALTACGEPEEESAGAGPEPVAAQPAEPEPEPAARVAVAIPFTPQSNPGQFPHNAHGQVACSTCHSGMPGHASHAGVTCVDCHATAGGAGQAATVSAAECNACHHSAEQTRACLDCHGSAPSSARAVSAEFRLSPRPTPIVRTLQFEHALHSGVQCSQCHGVGDTPATPAPCSACHQSHHRADADCSTCHAPFPLSTHDREAHRGCTGCHVEPTAVTLPMTRSVCLACHAAQVDHEPGQDCGRCHLVGDVAHGFEPAPGRYW